MAIYAYVAYIAEINSDSSVNISFSINLSVVTDLGSELGQGQ